jgi:hypothetical protein
MQDPSKQPSLYSHLWLAAHAVCYLALPESGVGSRVAAEPWSAPAAAHAHHWSVLYDGFSSRKGTGEAEIPIS